jgi:hypothetical protein
VPIEVINPKESSENYPKNWDKVPGKENIMSGQADTGAYRDLSTKSNERTQYFFLENILKARIELHLETSAGGYDEELNMYLADLLASLSGPSAFTENKPWVSPFDYEVHSYLNNHPDMRTEYEVYKENAEFGLAATSVFLEFHHKGSYWRRMIQNTSSTNRIGMYYKLAASALAHLRGSRATSVHVFLTLADHVGDASKIIRKISGECFEFIERLSIGSEFHLEKDLAGAGQAKLYSEKLDEFLRLYGECKVDPSQENRSEFELLSMELSNLNPAFKFKSDRS